jgi:peptidoglycan hydrolase CwlO-like protein
MADNASNTASDPANPKRGLREFENAYDLLEASHKRVKIENGELSFANEKLKTIKMQLEEEKTQLKQGLDEKEKRVQALEKELATKEDARAAEEKTAIEAVARAEQAEQKAEAQANAERAITNEALAAKARVELELRALRSARGP